MNPAWPRGSLFAVNRELPLTEASMPDRLTCSRINEEIHKLTLLRNGECQNDRAYLAMFLLLVVVTASAWAQTAATSGEVENVFPQARALYVDVHQNPELSGHETQTAEKLVSRLRTLGYEVTEHVGGNGIVALLKNGPGPTVMLRTELDALPVEEKTGLPYASKIHTKDDAGRDVPVMHACGHDLHMASLMGTATIMANTKNTWRGTLMLIGQPAEETITGAKKMIDDGLFTRFPKPDVAVALHTSNELPAGKDWFAFGQRDANAQPVRITLLVMRGRGPSASHTCGSIAHPTSATTSPQTITSREVKPGEAAVVTVGYIQAGTKNNIIPDQAELGMTVRSYKPEIP